MITQLAEVDCLKTGLLPQLIQDYLLQKPELSRFYKYPFILEAFGQAIADKTKDATDRELLVNVLKKQYAGIVTTEAVWNNIESLLSAKTFTVTASHQPSLFLGPLFNIYKIAGAIALSKQLKQAYPDYHFVPVFWLGSEDHDIEELNHTWINGQKLEWENAGTGAVGRLNTETLAPLVEQLKGLPVSADLVSIIETGLKQCNTFGKLTQYLTNEIFKEQGLLVLDQDDVQLKQRFAPVMEDEILHATGVSVLKDNISQLEQNYKAQAHPREINFFYLGEGYRERIVYNGEAEKFEVLNTGLSFTANEIQQAIKDNPAQFSPNVIFRPLYQEMILPNLAFIGGAGELSYWLELKPLFEHYKINYPIQVLRGSVCILLGSTVKKLEKLGLGYTDLFNDVEQVITRYIKGSLPAEVQLNGEKTAIEKVFDALAEKAAAADATLAQNVAAEKRKAISSIENIEGKMLKAEKRKQETAVNQIRAVHAVTFPEGNLQERTENFMAYYTPEFISEIVALLNPFTPSFHFVQNA